MVSPLMSLHIIFFGTLHDPDGKRSLCRSNRLTSTSSNYLCTTMSSLSARGTKVRHLGRWWTIYTINVININMRAMDRDQTPERAKREPPVDLGKHFCPRKWISNPSNRCVLGKRALKNQGSREVYNWTDPPKGLLTGLGDEFWEDSWIRKEARG